MSTRLRYDLVVNTVQNELLSSQSYFKLALHEVELGTSEVGILAVGARMDVEDNGPGLLILSFHEKKAWRLGKPVDASEKYEAGNADKRNGGSPDLVAAATVV